LDGGERLLVTGEEVLQGLRDGEGHIQTPAVREHQHEETQTPAGGTDGNRTVLAPVDLGAFAGGEGELQERLAARRTHLGDVVLEDRQPTAVARLSQALEDLLRAVGVALQQAHHLVLERIEPARPRCGCARFITRALHPLGYRLRVHAQHARRLRDGEPLAIMVIADLAEGLVVDHRPALICACSSAKRSRHRCGEISYAGAGDTGASSASTW